MLINSGRFRSIFSFDQILTDVLDPYPIPVVELFPDLESFCVIDEDGAGRDQHLGLSPAHDDIFFFQKLVELDILTRDLDFDHDIILSFL